MFGFAVKKLYNLKELRYTKRPFAKWEKEDAREKGGQKT